METEIKREIMQQSEGAQATLGRATLAPVMESRLAALSRRTSDAADKAVGIANSLEKILSGLECTPCADGPGREIKQASGLEGMETHLSDIESRHETIADRLSRLEELIGL